jgi:hypothetical protein
MEKGATWVAWCVSAYDAGIAVRSFFSLNVEFLSSCQSWWLEVHSIKLHVSHACMNKTYDRMWNTGVSSMHRLFSPELPGKSTMRFSLQILPPYCWSEFELYRLQTKWPYTRHCFLFLFSHLENAEGNSIDVIDLLRGSGQHHCQTWALSYYLPQELNQKNFNNIGEGG